MSVFISMLRGINVGSQKRMRMETLREIYIQLGLLQVRTYVQSGNVVFAYDTQDQSELTRRIEDQIEQTCGYPVDVFNRTAEELKHILTGNPFLISRNEDPGKLHVSFFYQPVSEAVLGKLSAPAGISDEFAFGQMAVYLFCPNGYGKTRLSNSFFERKLGISVTTRNWNTVNALSQMAVSELIAIKTRKTTMDRTKFVPPKISAGDQVTSKVRKKSALRH